MKDKLHSLLALAGMMLISLEVSASFHLWTISEVFSNSDGTIQFIELSTTSSSQQELSGQTITSSGPDLPTTAFTFDSDLIGDTANKQVLLATERFALLAGHQPDYVIPDGFVPRSEGVIDFADGTDTLGYATGQFPLNGTQSLSGEGQVQAPTPIRFDGNMVSLPEQVLPFASVDLTTNELEIPVLDAPGIGVFFLTLGIDFQAVEFEVANFFQYQENIEPGTQPAMFDGSMYLPSLVYLSDQYEVRLSIIQDPPLVFGDAQILSVTPVTPDPEPEPDPDPDPDPLEESITRGMQNYSIMCSRCHGASGGGTFQGPSLDLAKMLPFAQLRSIIDSSMPLAAPGSCTDNNESSCATDVANFILNRL